MAAGLVAARAAGRTPGLFQAWLLAAWAALLWDPRQPFNPGFDMTYAALLPIIFVLPRWAAPPSWPPAARLLWVAAAFELAMQAALAPALASFFGLVSPAACLLNPLAFPAAAAAAACVWAGWAASLLPAPFAALAGAPGRGGGPWSRRGRRLRARGAPRVPDRAPRAPARGGRRRRRGGLRGKESAAARFLRRARRRHPHRWPKPVSRPRPPCLALFHNADKAQAVAAANRAAPLGARARPGPAASWTGPSGSGPATRPSPSAATGRCCASRACVPAACRPGRQRGGWACPRSTPTTSPARSSAWPPAASSSNALMLSAECAASGGVRPGAALNDS